MYSDAGKNMYNEMVVVRHIHSTAIVTATFLVWCLFNKQIIDVRPVQTPEKCSQLTV